MPINGRSGEFDDIVEDGYVSGAVTVGTSAVEAKVGGSALDGRELLTIYNDSNSIIYYGPSGVTTSTGEPLAKKQRVSIPVGSAIQVFLIAGSGGNDVIVQEWA